MHSAGLRVRLECFKLFLLIVSCVIEPPARFQELHSSSPEQLDRVFEHRCCDCLGKRYTTKEDQGRIERSRTSFRFLLHICSASDVNYSRRYDVWPRGACTPSGAEFHLIVTGVYCLEAEDNGPNLHFARFLH